MFKALLSISRGIDLALSFIARLGAWLGLALVLVVCYDVVTRYFGVPKVWGLTSTKIQESEYWLHSYLIILVVGYAYIKQTHVRVDLIRERLSERSKYWIEAVGITIALIPYSILGAYLAIPYAVQSYLQGEISKSQTGLTDIWLLKSGLVVLFVLLGMAGLSQWIKAVAGICGQLPPGLRKTTLGGSHDGSG